MEDVLASEIDSYLEKNWESIVADIERVVRIESTEDLPAAKPGAPFGPGPRAALTEALDIARGMGFEVHDVDGYVGYADLPGESDTQIGIIGHVDPPVPAGRSSRSPSRAARATSWAVASSMTRVPS